MKISTKGRYALRLLIDLAEHSNCGYVSLKDVAERQEISKKYLEQIIPVFTKEGLLNAGRGVQGGYMLSKTQAKYTVGEVLRLTEGSLAPVACLENEASICQRTAECATLPMWKGLYKVINEYLDGITLQDLLNEQKKKYANDYVI